jgi:hypothetical protein
MSDRWVFLTAFLTAVLILAAAFQLPQFFLFESAKSAVFVAIAILAFFGEDRYSYMLGMVFPPLWFLIDIVAGGLSGDFRVLVDYFTGRGVAPLETPLHGLARLTAVLLVIASFRAWRKTVPERMLGKTLRTCALIAAAYAAVLAFWYAHIFAVAATSPLTK